MRIAYFASGNGTTFQYLAERLSREQENAVSALLVSSAKKAYALERAKQLGIGSVILQRREFHSDSEFAEAMLSALKVHEIDFICLAGYMKLVPQKVVKSYRNRILNVHPALLPAFGGAGMYGRRVHEAVIASGARVSGATVHLVNEEYDRGLIAAQQAVHVSSNDTAELLEARIQRIEKQLYYNTLLLFIQNRVEIHDNRIHYLPPIPND
ncbi:phosphoribosylglycinamide formyltransferase [bacterium]|nr:MAG: phosphoribosylglycinamide formyltransferase [bacterium]